ncbi:WD40-like Beta Propeller [Penicillium riverlandense]|uniref:WD40-like Beta Propeller n=1 Tax=Penicillium riverlandense TaxID=1903569 RepID=UPI0025476BCC|nr:WD40-like Beta Propeller [Penicillium riverlandense]KAJ5806788.1 WD40-like Beta Propeller [Penicillium riverlandense]
MPTNAHYKSDLSLDALADLQVPSDLKISPDGTKIAYGLRAFRGKTEHSKSSIWIADIGKEKSARQFTSGLFNDEQPQWSPDGASIAFRSDRAQPGSGSAVYVMSLGGGEAYPVTPAENQTHIEKFEWSPNGLSIAYTSADEKTDEQVRREKEKDDAKVWGEELKYRRLRVVHVTTKQVRILVGGERDVSNFSWSRDGQRIAYVQHRDPDINSAGFYGADICSVSLSTEKSSTITHFPGPIYRFAWGDAGIYFVAGFISTHCSTSRVLYRVVCEESSYMQQLKTLGAGNHIDEDRRLGEGCCAFGLVKNQSSLAILVQNGLEDAIYMVDVHWSNEVYRGEHDIATFDVAETAEGVVSAITKSDGSTPEEVFSVSPFGDPIQLSNHNSVLAALKVSTAQTISAIGSDNYPLDGVMYLPSRFKEGDAPLPTILLPHGGPYSRVGIGFSICNFAEVPLLVSAGYGVLCPNYRGGSGRGQKHAAYASGGVGTVDYEDCIAILRAAINEGLVDASRVAIGGHSQGGFLSYLAVTRTGFQFRAALCSAGVTDWDLMTMTSDAYWFEADMAGGSPWDVDSNAEENATETEKEGRQSKTWIRQTAGRRGSALWHMRNVKTPILIIHGEADERVPLSQAVAFYRACIHNNVPVKMVTYPREGHIYMERKHIIDMWARMKQFYDLHLG